MMRKHLFILIMLLLSVQLALAQKYEYWLDNDYQTRTIVSSAADSISFNVDISQKPTGVHYLTIRLQNENNEWGGISRYMFFVPEQGDDPNNLVKYEYWIDNQYDNRSIVVCDKVASVLSIDISNFTTGVHFFSFRTQGASGQWGGMSRYMFFVPEQGDDPNNLVKYEYWLDNQYENKTIVESDNVASALTIDVSNLATGVHYFSFRTQGASGQWGGLAHYMFYVNHESIQGYYKVSNCEFWIDENRDYVVSQESSDSLMVITMNIIDLPKGDHLFHIYGKTENGECALFESLSFNAPHLPVVPKPVITSSGNTITISDGEGVDSDSVIVYRYTLDGSTPTSKSAKYDRPFAVTRNDTLRVIGIQYAHENSEVAEFIIDWFKVATPTGSQKGNMLKMSCSTTGATIYYKIGDGDEQAYSSAVRLPDQLVVTAIGRREGYNDSEPLFFQLRPVKSATPVITYDGRYLKIVSSEEGVELYYTADGSSPASGLDVGKNAQHYEGRMTIDSLCTIKAVAIIDSMNVSDVFTYPVDYLYNGETAFIRKEGTVSSAFEWYGGMNKIEALNIEGRLNSKDIDTLRNLPIIRHLDLSKTTIVSGQLPADAFEGSQMISFISPEGINSVGGRLFADCPRLAAVVWNADVALKDNTFEGVNNPNLLLYVNKANLKPVDVNNVVIDGVAENIVLKDSTEGNTNFYCPKPFTATNISYTHNYKQQTAIGVVRGWETLTLPFNVQTITHENHGALKPFDAEGEGKPFWLMKLDREGLKHVTTIEANQPYVISMPNNSNVYAEEYNQGGKVTFSAQNTEVPITDPQDNSSADMTFRPVYQLINKAAGIYALNVGKELDGNPEGSIFKSDYRDLRPFEVSLIHSGNASRTISLSRLGMGDGSTGIMDVMLRDDAESPDNIVRIHTLSGILLKQGNRNETLRSLPKGIYIVNGKKVVVK